jgi:hypothetical protein
VGSTLHQDVLLSFLNSASTLNLCFRPGRHPIHGNIAVYSPGGGIQYTEILPCTAPGGEAAHGNTAVYRPGARSGTRQYCRVPAGAWGRPRGGGSGGDTGLGCQPPLPVAALCHLSASSAARPCLLLPTALRPPLLPPVGRRNLCPVICAPSRYRAISRRYRGDIASFSC